MSKWLTLAAVSEEIKSTPADIPTKPDKTRPPKSNRKLGYVGLCPSVGYRGAPQNSNRNQGPWPSQYQQVRLSRRQSALVVTLQSLCMLSACA